MSVYSFLPLLLFLYYLTVYYPKIKIALDYGLERRPKRAKSAERFLSFALPEMQKAVDTKDTSVFNNSFEMLTANCNSCHAMEKGAFFTVKIPTERQSPIRFDR